MQRQRTGTIQICLQSAAQPHIHCANHLNRKGRVDNPDYLFLSRHYEAVQEYLSLLDWDLRKDELNGYFYVLNTDEANRCNLNKKETAILLALRLMCRKYGAFGFGAGCRVYCAGCAGKSGDRLSCFPAKPSMEEVKRALYGAEKPFPYSKTGRKNSAGQLRDRNTAHHFICGLSEKLNLLVSV